VLNESQQLGRYGELIASKYLEKKGYKILFLNYSKQRWGEIDIIAIDKEEIVFVEVKTRKTNRYGSALESINPYKLKSLRNSINYFLKAEGRHYRNFPMRIDAIGINTSQNSHKARLEHIKAIS